MKANLIVEILYILHDDFGRLNQIYQEGNDRHRDLIYIPQFTARLGPASDSESCTGPAQTTPTIYIHLKKATFTINTMQAEELAEVLRQLSSELVAARLAFTGDPSAFEHEPYLSAAAPLFAALHAVNRMSLNFTKECKARTQDARLEMDGAHLRLQVSILAFG